ncbi:MAG: hypothetical protein M3380_12145 [Chloroflexota bacterium]|nr:hypothetical protein [Chloroflexota bacterium]
MSELHDHHIAVIETAALTCRYPRRIGRNARLGSHGEGMTSPIFTSGPIKAPAAGGCCVASLAMSTG